MNVDLVLRTDEARIVEEARFEEDASEGSE